MCSPKRVYCFVCYKPFSKNIKSDKCKTCGDFKCPLCKGCLCSLTVGEQKVALAMIRTYENILGTNYDFTQHCRIEKKVIQSLQSNKRTKDSPKV